MTQGKRKPAKAIATGDGSGITRPDLVARVEAAGLTDSGAERDAGLPQAFLSKARRGGCAGPGARASWIKLQGWLDQHHPTGAAKGARVVADNEATLDEFAGQIRASVTLEEVEAVGRRAEELLVLGVISERMSDALAKLLHQRRMAIETRMEHAAKIQGNAPVKVEVEWSTICPSCGAAIGDWSQPSTGEGEEDEAT